MTKHHRDCLHLFEEVGLTVLGIEHRGGHLKFRCSEGMLVCPSTPSDRRWRVEMRAQARRLKRRR